MPAKFLRSSILREPKKTKINTGPSKKINTQISRPAFKAMPRGNLRSSSSPMRKMY